MTEAGGIETQGKTNWSQQACWVLVKEHQAIEDLLLKQQRLDDFRREIQRWRNSYLNENPFAADVTAMALFDICQSFELIKFLDQRQQGKAIRTRGAPSGGTAKGVSLEQGLREVGRVFS